MNIQHNNVYDFLNISNNIKKKIFQIKVNYLATNCDIYDRQKKNIPKKVKVTFL